MHGVFVIIQDAICCWGVSWCAHLFVMMLRESEGKPLSLSSRVDYWQSFKYNTYNPGIFNIII